ncbi:hypothetical protein PVAG01_07420 [Phlyctema vagabunda]|uniref:Low temperature requirement A n=1 Tax=Phlyctema vagabunda TaxID=108571 RepID=A0ABR4PCC5_9HELO
MVSSFRSASSSTVSLDPSPDKKALTRDKVSRGPRKKLRLFESPLAHERAASPEPLKPLSVLDISGPVGVARLDESRKSSVANIYDERKDGQHPGKPSEMRETPEFRRYEETTNIELFYDLFFVANLTTFTDVHDTNGTVALKAYAGFFCLLWFLWLQVSLFDVRFVTDSILERIGKACQFGVMIGLAVVGPRFDPSNQRQSTFKALAMILMLSRIVLGFQYMIVLWQVWNYRDSKLPLFLIVCTSFVAAFIYFGTFFGFKGKDPNGKIFIVWYITVILETIINIVISVNWKVLSFEGSHLVQRMSLLTLIILGEGIIGVAKSIAIIVENDGSWTIPLTGTVMSAVTLIYFIYMIYFDWMNRDHFGSIRQEIWAFLHFPFHLALVLLVEGTTQFILWRKVVEIIHNVHRTFTVALTEFHGTNSPELAELLAEITAGVFAKFPPRFSHTPAHAQKEISSISESTFNSTGQRSEISTLYSIIQDSLFDNFGIDPPISEDAMMENPDEQWNKNMEAFMLVFVYFFISAGITLIVMDILNTISHPNSSRRERARLVTNAILGLGLCLVAATARSEAGLSFAQSAWVLPTVALTFVSGAPSRDYRALLTGLGRLVMALSYSKFAG